MIENLGNFNFTHLGQSTCDFVLKPMINNDFCSKALGPQAGWGIVIGGSILSILVISRLSAHNPIVRSLYSRVALMDATTESVEESSEEKEIVSENSLQREEANSSQQTIVLASNESKENGFDRGSTTQENQYGVGSSANSTKDQKKTSGGFLSKIGIGSKKKKTSALTSPSTPIPAEENESKANKSVKSTAKKIGGVLNKFAIGSKKKKKEKTSELSSPSTPISLEENELQETESVNSEPNSSCRDESLEENEPQEAESVNSELNPSLEENGSNKIEAVKSEPNSSPVIDESFRKNELQKTESVIKGKLTPMNENKPSNDIRPALSRIQSDLNSISGPILELVDQEKTTNLRIVKKYLDLFYSQIDTYLDGINLALDSIGIDTKSREPNEEDVKGHSAQDKKNPTDKSKGTERKSNIPPPSSPKSILKNPSEQNSSKQRNSVNINENMNTYEKEEEEETE